MCLMNPQVNTFLLIFLAVVQICSAKLKHIHYGSNNVGIRLPQHLSLISKPKLLRKKYPSLKTDLTNSFQTITDNAHIWAMMFTK